MPKLQVQCIPVGSFQSNCYLVENTENGQCLVVSCTTATNCCVSTKAPPFPDSNHVHYTIFAFWWKEAYHGRERSGYV